MRVHVYEHVYACTYIHSHEYIFSHMYVTYHKIRPDAYIYRIDSQLCTHTHTHMYSQPTTSAIAEEAAVVGEGGVGGGGRGNFLKYVRSPH